MKTISYIIDMWDKYSFEIILIACIIVILFLGLYRKIRGQKGTWSKSFYFPYYSRDDTQLKIFKPKKNTSSKGEEECRRVLEAIFRKPFSKDRPNFLRNPVTGGSFNLELDCYNPELRLAVEYNGVQHYKHVPYFHKNKEAFLNQKYRDFIKRNMCKDNNIYLVEVPYFIKTEDIENYLIKELRLIGFQI